MTFADCIMLTFTKIDYSCISYEHFHLIPRANRKQANLRVIQANLSDIQANRSDIYASVNVVNSLRTNVIQRENIVASVIPMLYNFKYNHIFILLLSCPISIGAAQSNDYS